MSKINAEEILRQINEAKWKASDSGRPEAVAKQHALGKLTARERIDLLLDPGSFLEYGILVDHGHENEVMEKMDAPADGTIIGLGKIEGRPVAVGATDFTVMGGSNGLNGMLKMTRIIRLAMESGCPLILLTDGGGHRIQEGLDSRHFASASGEFFFYQAKMSGWVPMVAAMMGPGFAGPANFSAMSDFVPIVKGTGTIGIAGPALVKHALGEEMTKEELGGSGFQTRETGMADLEAEDDTHCLSLIREFLSFFPSNSGELPPVIPNTDPANRRDEELLHIVPESSRYSYDMYEIIRRIVDHGYHFELKPWYSRNIITTLARMNGRPVGIIANQPRVMGGLLNTGAAEKAAHFISMCDAYGFPLIFLTDIPGFMPGRESERTGLVRHSGKMIYEIGQATVPKINIVLRKSYGLGYLAMCGGRSFMADLAVAWPTAEICALQVEGAVDVAFRREVQSAPDPEKKRTEMIAHFRTFLTAQRGAEGFGIDDVIDPRDTRSLIIRTLEFMPHRKLSNMPPKKHGIVPV